MRPNKLLYVDTMRGWAILMVIACHQALPFRHLFLPIQLLAAYGQTGVFLFFVTSSFTLCNSAIERQNESNPTRNFFIRRFFRIAPLYYLGILLYSGLKLPCFCSSVALPIMWRSAKQAAIFAPFQVFERHIIGARRRRRMPIRLFG